MMLLALVHGCSLLPRDDDDEARPDPSTAAADAPAEIVLDPTALAGAGITTGPALSGVLPQTLRVPGTLALDPAHEARVGSPVDAKVTRVLARVGDPVTTSTVLAWVRSPEIAEARAAWTAATALRTAALATRDRTKLLLADGVSSQAELLDAEAELADAEGGLAAARQRLAVYGVTEADAASASPDAPLRSPVAGEVLEAEVTVGGTLAADADAFHVGGLDPLVLLLAVPDAQVARVTPSLTVSFNVEGVAGGPFSATVEAVGAWVDPEARTVNVRATAPNPKRALRPNQFADATILLADDEDIPGIVLPADAVQAVDGHDVVFVAGAEPGHFVPRRVDVAERAGGRVRIEGGVKEGESVVLTGAFTLRGELTKGEAGDDDD